MSVRLLRNEDTRPLAKANALASLSTEIPTLAATSHFRMWTLCIAAFAEIVEPRGGAIGVATLATVFGHLGVSPAVLRTTLARLCERNALNRKKVGRNSYYELSDWAARETLRKAAIVYAHHGSTFNGIWTQVVLTGNLKSHAATIEKLREDGFGEIAGGVYMVPESARSHRFEDLSDCITLAVTLTDPQDIHKVVSLGWNLERIEHKYRHFILRWAPIYSLLEEGALFDGLDAVALRVLLIYEFRRCCLTHPALPFDFGGRDWVGKEARELCGRLWRSFLQSSETWLDEYGVRHDGQLPPAKATLRTRFAI